MAVTAVSSSGYQQQWLSAAVCCVVLAVECICGVNSDNDELSATMLAVQAGRAAAASRYLSHCCSCTFTYNGLSSTGIHRNLPGWGSGTHIRLAPQSKSRKESVAASEQAVDDLQQCAKSTARVLNEVVGHELVTVEVLDSSSRSTGDEGPSGAGWIYLSIECFENPKRHGNTISTRSKGAPFQLMSVSIELKHQSEDGLLNCLLHELGHGLGLHNHLSDPSEMMTAHNGGWRDGCANVGPTTSRALAWLYPPPAAKSPEGEPTVCTKCYFEGWWTPKELESTTSGLGSRCAKELQQGEQALNWLRQQGMTPAILANLLPHTPSGVPAAASLLPDLRPARPPSSGQLSRDRGHLPPKSAIHPPVGLMLAQMRFAIPKVSPNLKGSMRSLAREPWVVSQAAQNSAALCCIDHLPANLARQMMPRDSRSTRAGSDRRHERFGLPPFKLLCRRGMAPSDAMRQPATFT